MECNCVNCNCSIQLCKYKCDASGYNIYENNIFIKKQYDCDIDTSDSEIDTESNIEYCSMCNINIEYPDSYDNNNHVFTNNGDNMYYYENFLKRNIIHNFENIQCEHCSNILEKGTFTIEIIEETGENMNNLSIPNDFIKDIHIYNQGGELVKTIEPNDYQEYKELHNYTSNDSKNLLYCNDCNFCILNSLKKIYR